MTIVLEAGPDPHDFRRNGKDQPIVKHPDTGRDTPYDRPSKWFDDYSGIDPVYALRGSWVHKQTEHIDNGVAWSADLDFVAQGVGLGIPADTQHDIARAWQRFKAAHGLTIIHNEATVVNDDLRVAGTLDRIVDWQGRRCVLDIKTGSKVDKTSYAVQLARYARSFPYDVHTDERGRWDRVLSQTIGLVAHLRLNDILKGSQGTQFELVAVDLVEGHLAAEQLYDLTSLDLSDSFSTIAAPTTPPVVEQPAGGDAGTANAASLPATLDEWRAAAQAWQPAKVEAFKKYRQDYGYTANDTDESKLNAYRDFDEVYHFKDVTSVPQTRNITTEPPKAPKPPVDEGAEIDADVVSLAGQRYARLPDAVRSWVSIAGGNIRLNPDHGGKPTERRATLLGALCELAESEMDDDDGLRAICAHIIGDIAWQSGATVGDVVASLDVAEAHRFAGLASLVCMSLAPFEFLEGDVRCVLADGLGVAA